MQGIVYFHAPPYRTLDYGHPSDIPFRWADDASVPLSPGEWLPDELWEALRAEMEVTPCPSS